MQVDFRGCYGFAALPASVPFLILFAALAWGDGAAHVQISGGPDAVTIDARRVTVTEILASLALRYDVHLSNSVEVGRIWSGTYTGTLPNVISRLLTGYDFVLKVSGKRVEVMIVGMPAGTPSAADLMSNKKAVIFARRNSVSVATRLELTEPMEKNVAGPASKYSATSTAVLPYRFKNSELSSMLLKEAQVEISSTVSPLPALRAPLTWQSSDVANLIQSAESRLVSLAFSLRGLQPSEPHNSSTK